MFPDSLAETPGCYVGIVLSSELPAADRETFKDLLTQLVDLRIQVSLYYMYGGNVTSLMPVAGVNGALCLSCFSVFGEGTIVGTIAYLLVGLSI